MLTYYNYFCHFCHEMRRVLTSVSNVVVIINTSHLSARLYLHDLDAWRKVN